MHVHNSKHIGYKLAGTKRNIAVREIILLIGNCGIWVATNAKTL